MRAIVDIDIFKYHPVAEFITPPALDQPIKRDTELHANIYCRGAESRALIARGDKQIRCATPIG